VHHGARLKDKTEGRLGGECGRKASRRLYDLHGNEEFLPPLTKGRERPKVAGKKGGGEESSNRREGERISKKERTNALPLDWRERAAQHLRREK